MGVGGALGLDGAIWSQSRHLSRRPDMEIVIPGQKTVESTLAIIDVTP